MCESPSFARTFAKRLHDIRLRYDRPGENFIAHFGGRSAAIRLMLLFCSAQPHRPMPETMDGQPPLPVPAVCPATLDELLAED